MRLQWEQVEFLEAQIAKLDTIARAFDGATPGMTHDQHELGSGHFAGELHAADEIRVGDVAGDATNVTVNLVAPGTMYGDRINQFDLRFGRTFRFGPRRVTGNLDIYNVFNASPVMQLNNAYAFWLMTDRYPPFSLD